MKSGSGNIHLINVPSGMGDSRMTLDKHGQEETASAGVRMETPLDNYKDKKADPMESPYFENLDKHHDGGKSKMTIETDSAMPSKSKVKLVNKVNYNSTSNSLVVKKNLRKYEVNTQ